MTTIAYRDGVLAGDTAAWAGDVVTGRTVKVHKLADGRLVGCSGDHQTASQFRRWLEGIGEKPEPAPADLGFRALVINRDGTVEHWGDRVIQYDLEGDFFAIGSGEPYALAAMMAGADAVRSVEIAAELSPSARLPVIAVRLGLAQ